MLKPTEMRKPSNDKGNRTLRRRSTDAADLPPVLRNVIKPLEKYFRVKGLNEICINKPGEIWLETVDGWHFEKDSDLTLETLNAFNETIATVKGQQFNRNHPLLSTQIPGYGYRLQSCGEALTEFKVAMAIRVGATQVFPLSSYFNHPPLEEPIADIEEITDLHDDRFLEHMIKTGKNFLVSGGTGAGKTSLINSMIATVPADQRVVVIEDTQELEIPHSNYVRLLKSKNGSGIASVTYQDILNATTRLRPDRIFMGEIDTHNAFPFLRSINTGHSGCLTTLHANDPQGAIKALIQNVMLSPEVSTDADHIVDYAKQALDYIVQIAKRPDKLRGLELMDVKSGETIFKSF